MVATGGGLGGVLLGQLGKHGMQRADREDIGTQAAGTDGQLFECAGVAQTAITRSAQGIDLGGDTPYVIASGQLRHTRAGAGGTGQQPLPLVADQSMVATGLTRQVAAGVCLQVDFTAVFALQSTVAAGRQSLTQVYRQISVGDDQVAGLGLRRSE